jgi:hypothetical protein
VKTPTLILVLFCTFFSHACAPAADLTKISRRLVKEPAYKNKPQYCLLVFGAEAKFRVWLVLDGEILYVDCNGNGDLTEKGKRFKLRPSPHSEHILVCEVGDLIDPQTKTKHTNLRISHSAPDWYTVSAQATFMNPKVARLSGTAWPRFARRPADAPVVHFGGPLTLGHSFATCNDRPSDICARIGTPGVGTGSFVDYSLSVLKLTQARPDVELEYRGEKAATVREKAKLHWHG